MRAISLWQPWATAIAIGIKKIETRGWETGYRGPLAIHAAKRWAPDQREFASIEHTLGRLPKRIPFGAVIATCRLIDCTPTWRAEPLLTPIERIYGNYGEGRYAWYLDEVISLPEPIPFVGKQGFFQVPDELLRATA